MREQDQQCVLPDHEGLCKACCGEWALPCAQWVAADPVSEWG